MLKWYVLPPHDVDRYPVRLWDMVSYDGAAEVAEDTLPTIRRATVMAREKR